MTATGTEAVAGAATGIDPGTERTRARPADVLPSPAAPACVSADVGEGHTPSVVAETSAKPSGAASEAASEAKQAARGPWVERLGRAGLVAQGVSYGLVGALALMLALGLGGEAESREGALRTLAGNTAGLAVLVALAIGFAGYAIWRLAQAIFDRDGEGTDGKGLAKRASRAGKAVIYAALCFTTVQIVLDGRRASSGGGEPTEDSATAGVLGWPAGRWIVLGVGVAILGVAGYQVWRAFSEKFMKDMETSRLSPAAETAVEALGITGLLARGVVFGLVGIFLVKAALEYDPDEAIGLDGALATLAGASYGSILLGLTAAGLVAYGLFCVVQARYRRI